MRRGAGEEARGFILTPGFIESVSSITAFIEIRAAGSSEMIVSEVKCRNYPHVDKEKETEKNYSNLCK